MKENEVEIVKSKKRSIFQHFYFPLAAAIDRLMAFMMTDGCYPKRFKMEINIYELLDQIVEREAGEKEGRSKSTYFSARWKSGK